VPKHLEHVLRTVTARSPGARMAPSSDRVTYTAMRRENRDAKAPITVMLAMGI